VDIRHEEAALEQNTSGYHMCPSYRSNILVLRFLLRERKNEWDTRSLFFLHLGYWYFSPGMVIYVHQGQIFVGQGQICAPGTNICTRVKYLSQGHNYVPGPVTRSCDEVSGVQKNISGTIYATVFGLF
jgi:hypothetical protein